MVDTNVVKLKGLPRSEKYLSSFVPLNLWRLTRGQESAENARVVSRSGVALFVDFSGSTAVARQSALEDEDGAATLVEGLHDGFSGIVKSVIRYGGEVVFFAGDAVVACWYDKNDQFDESVALAQVRDCATDLLLNISETTHAHGFEGLHIGIELGELVCVRTPEIDHSFRLFVGGSAIRGAAMAVRRASANNFRFGYRANQWLESSGVELNYGGPASALNFTIEDGEIQRVISDTRKILPAAVSRHDIALGDDWLLRTSQIVALHLVVRGAQDDSVDLPEVLAEIAERVIAGVAVTTHSRGVMGVDETGFVFTCIFGGPHDSAEQPDARAVQIAKVLERELSGATFQWGIGIASGRAVMGVVGTKERREYLCVGYPTYAAARLANSIREGILLSEEVVRQIKETDSINIQRQQPLDLKGSGETVTFRLLDHDSVIAKNYYEDDNNFETNLPSLVGRETEIKAVETLLIDTQAGTRRAMMMVGEAGIGKTTLAGCAISLLRQQNSLSSFAYSVARARHREHTLPFDCWNHTIRSNVERVLRSHTDSRFRTVDQYIVDVLRRHKVDNLAFLLSPFLLVGVESTLEADRLTGLARAEATHGLMLLLLKSVVPERSLVIVEDCHWMDSSERRLLISILRDAREFGLLLTSRPTPYFSPDDQALISDLEFLNIDPISLASSSALIGHLLGNSNTGDALSKKVFDYAGGNPFLTKHYIKWLENRRSVIERSGILVLESYEAVDEIPRSIEHLLSNRLDELESDERLVAQICSVYGNHFRRSHVGTIIERFLPKDAIKRMFNRLVSRGILRELADQEIYQFDHQLLYDCTYESLSAIQRREFHAVVAGYFEGSGDSGVNSRDAVLAHHWFRARDYSKAIPYLNRVAETALACGAYGEALDALIKCVTHSDGSEFSTEPRIGIWNRLISDAYLGLGDPDLRAVHARQALTDSEKLLPTTEPVALLGILWRAAVRLAVPKKQYSSQSTRAIQTLERLKSHRALSAANYHLNRPACSLYHSFRSVELGERLPPTHELSGAYSELGGFLGVFGAKTLARRYLTRAIDMTQNIPNLENEAHVHMVNCLYSVGNTDWHESQQSVNECLRLSNEANEQVNTGNAMTIDFWICYYTGDLTAAERKGQALADHGSRTGNIQHESWGRHCELFAILQACNSQQIAQNIENRIDSLWSFRANEVFKEDEVHFDTAFAYALWCSGQTKDAISLYKPCVDFIMGAKRFTRHSVNQVIYVLYQLALEMQNNGERNGKTLASLRLAMKRQATRFPAGKPKYYMVEALECQRRGSNRAASKAIQMGIDFATRHNMQGDLARLREMRTICLTE